MVMVVLLLGVQYTWSGKKADFWGMNKSTGLRFRAVNPCPGTISLVTSL
jgi:hypothetical protein